MRILRNHQREALFRNRRHAAIRLGDSGGTSGLVIQQRHFSEHTAWQDGLQHALLPDDVHFAVQDGIHQVIVGLTFSEDKLTSREGADIGFILEQGESGYGIPPTKIAD
jgi:hypothetical protein